MSFKTLLSAAAIAALTATSPALAYGPSMEGPSLSYSPSIPQKAMSHSEREEMNVAFAIVKKSGDRHLLVRLDDGSKRQFRKCDTSDNCTNDDIKAYLSNNPDAAYMPIICKNVGGCVITGRPGSDS